MKDVLQPLNEKAADIIVNRINLLDSPNINPLLLQFVAHVSAYRVILKRCVGIAFSCHIYMRKDFISDSCRCASGAARMFPEAAPGNAAMNLQVGGGRHSRVVSCVIPRQGESSTDRELLLAFQLHCRPMRLPQPCGSAKYYACMHSETLPTPVPPCLLSRPPCSCLSM
jgi:hypothetical protein